MFCVKQIQQYIINVKHDVSVPFFTFVPSRLANTLKISEGLRVVLKTDYSPMLTIIFPTATVSTAGAIVINMLAILSFCLLIEKLFY